VFLLFLIFFDYFLLLFFLVFPDYFTIFTLRPPALATFAPFSSIVSSPFCVRPIAGPGPDDFQIHRQPLTWLREPFFFSIFPRVKLDFSPGNHQPWT